MIAKTSLKFGESENPIDNQPKLLSFSAFANRIGVCTATVRRMAARGEIKTKVFNSRLIRIPVEELSRIALA